MGETDDAYRVCFLEFRFVVQFQGLHACHFTIQLKHRNVVAFGGFGVAGVAVMQDAFAAVDVLGGEGLTFAKVEDDGPRVTPGLSLHGC